MTEERTKPPRTEAKKTDTLSVKFILHCQSACDADCPELFPYFWVGLGVGMFSGVVIVSLCAVCVYTTCSQSVELKEAPEAKKAAGEEPKKKEDEEPKKTEEGESKKSDDPDSKKTENSK